MRVLLAVTNTIERVALKRLLEQDTEFSVVGEAAEMEGLLAQTLEIRPNLLLLDWGLPGLPATGLLYGLHSVGYPLKVIAFSEDRKACQEAMAAGVDAFFSRDEPSEWLLTALRSVGGLSPCFAG